MTAVNTTYFAEQVVRDCVNGHCHHFAIALTRITGWPIGILWSDPPKPEESDLLFSSLITHVFCVAPDGRAIDVEGVHEQDSLPGLYECRRPRFEVVDEAGLLTLCEPGSQVIAPHVNHLSIAAADKFIRGSDAFMALLQQLQTPDTTQVVLRRLGQR